MTQSNELKFRGNGDYAKTHQDGKIVLTFRDGEKFTFDPDKASMENRHRALMYGFEVRLERSMAVEILKFPDKAARRAEARRRLTATIAHLESGATVWDIPRATVAKATGPSEGDIVQAIMRWRACSIDAANDLVWKLAEKRTIDRSAALRVFGETDKVKVALAEIEAERRAKAAAAAPVSAEDLLGEIEGDVPETDGDKEAPF